MCVGAYFVIGFIEKKIFVEKIVGKANSVRNVYAQMCD